MFEPMDIDQHDPTSSNAPAPQVVACRSANLSQPVTEHSFDVFLNFPRLPLELRDMVWDFVAQVPRVFIVDHRYWTRARLDHESRAAAVHSILHVNKESRRVALNAFEPYASRWGKPIYFNFKKDVLRVRGEIALAALCGVQLGTRDSFSKHFQQDVREWHVKLRHLEITGLGLYSQFETRAIQWMKCLETLTVDSQSFGDLKNKESAEEKLRSELAKHWLGPTNKLPIITASLDRD